MNKKAFTLIEIIVCICIISLLTLACIFILNKNKKSGLEKLNNKIAAAVDVYINIEKDSNDRNIYNEIVNNKSGVIIPMQKLIKKGYIDSKTITPIKKDDVIKNSYVLALLGNGIEGNDCNGVSIKIKWSDVIDKNSEEEIYLCKSDNNNNNNNNSKYLVYKWDYLSCELYDNDNNMVAFSNEDWNTSFYYEKIDISKETNLKKLKCHETNNNMEATRWTISYGLYPGGRDIHIGTYSGTLKWSEIPDLLDENIYYAEPIYEKPLINIVNNLLPSDGKSNYVSPTSSNNYLLLNNQLWLILGKDEENDVKIVLKDDIGKINTKDLYNNQYTYTVSNGAPEMVKTIMENWYNNLNIKNYFQEKTYCKGTSMESISKYGFLSIDDLKGSGIYIGDTNYASYFSKKISFLESDLLSPFLTCDNVVIKNQTLKSLDYSSFSVYNDIENKEIIATDSHDETGTHSSGGYFTNDANIVGIRPLVTISGQNNVCSGNGTQYNPYKLCE